MAFTRIFTPVLDGGLINIGDGAVRKQTVRIESGEYTPPIWLRTPSGVVIPVTSLPWQGVINAGQLEVLSSAPGGGAVVAEFYSIFEGADWRDNGKWQYQGGNGSGDPDDIFSIFTTSLDPDVPGGRGWRSQQFSTWFAEMWQVLENAPGSRPSVPAVGEVTSWRHFTKIIGSDPDGDYHSVGFGTGNLLSSAGAGGAIWTWVGGGSPVQGRLEVAGSAETQPHSTSTSVIPRDEWCRFEYNWARVATSTWDLDIRIYNEAGTLIASETTILENFGSGPDDLDGDVITFGTASQRTIMEIGVPGLGSVQAPGYEMERHAAFAAITDSVAHGPMPYGYFSHET